MPPLPGKAWGRQLPFRKDDGIFDDDFIEDRRKGLEAFINKYDILISTLCRKQKKIFSSWNAHYLRSLFDTVKYCRKIAVYWAYVKCRMFQLNHPNDKLCENVAVCVYRVAGHPLAQNERCLHMFLLEPVIDKNYVPGKVRTTWCTWTRMLLHPTILCW